MNETAATPPATNSDKTNPPAPLAVSVVLPIYNEESCIAAVIDELAAVLDARFPGRHEIVAVDDGSTDATPRLLREARTRLGPRLRVLRLVPNSGQSAAFCAGFHAARGAAVVTMDADGQNDPADIPRVVAALEGADCCCGYRATRRDRWSRRIASRLANAVRNRALGEEIIDTGCSLKAFRAEIARRMQPWDGLHRFFASFVLMQGGHVCQVAVNHRPRAGGRSKYTNWKRLRKTVRDLRGVRWLKSRARPCRVETEAPAG